jgi:NAD(P)-dependent dehydrogenase (short-subunit alcohol dehydrogenase family)
VVGVTKTEDLGSAFDWTVEYSDKFDIAFNNAGISGEDLFADEPGDRSRIIDTDLTAVMTARVRSFAWMVRRTPSRART